MKISYYDKYNSVKPRRNITVYKALEDIKNGAYKEIIKDVRLLINDKPKRDLEKKKLPLLGFGGTFGSRGNAELLQSSGLAMLDFDHVENLQDLRDDVDNDAFTFASFVSPSGDGLKVLVKIPLVANDKDYKSFYLEIQRYYDKFAKTDDSTKDISRATFVSYDPNLHLNINSEMFTDRFVTKVIKRKDVVIPISDMGEIANRLIKWFNKKWSTGQNRNNNLFMLSSAFNDFGVDKSIAIDYCMSYVSNDFKEQEINNLVNSAYKKIENFGTKSFEDKSKLQTVKKMVFVGSDKKAIKQRIGDFNGIDEVIDKIESENSKDIFWSVDDKGKINISFYRFDIYLKNKGISKYFQDKDSAVYDFITKDNNFINWIDTKRIKDIVKKDLIKRAYIDVWDLMAENTKYFSSEYLSMLDTLDIDYKRDDAKSSYLFFKNYAVKTTKDDIQLLKYNDIKDLIWSNQVIERDINLKPKSDGVFKSFIWKVSGEDADRYYTLKSVIGYLLHSYQNDAKPKAIIWNDEMVSDDVPNGGSGKGLIHKAISKLKSVVIEDGKKFDPKSQFAYQKIRKDTQVFLMDDVSKNFVFENLFSIITEGITIEKKGKDPFHIPYNQSPKLSITTNYTVRGEGASFNRRTFEVEIANYFNDKHTPEDEFKHQFFSGWDDAEWQRFDNFMIRCIQYFLKNGLVESLKVNLEFRKLKNNISAEFIEFMQSKDLTNFRVGRKEFRDDFNKQYPNLSRFNSAQKFNKKVKEYCNFYKLTCKDDVKFNGVLNFEINDPTKQDKEINFDEVPF